MNNVYKIEEYDFTRLNFEALPKPKGGSKNQPGKARKKEPLLYANAIASFDLETTRLAEIEQSILYLWQFNIHTGDVNDCIIGRQLDSYKDLLYNLRQRLGENLKLVIWVHNLSHEFHYLAGIYNFQNHEVFCTDSHKILKCTMYTRFEYRCTYKLTNMGLRLAAKTYNKYFFKQPEIDYTVRRFPDTTLDSETLDYATGDVFATTELVERINSANGDTLYTMPYTSTGYVRRDIKEATRGYTAKLAALYPSYDAYKLLRSAFRGGDTHANRYLAGTKLEHVKSRDISSSYPFQMATKLFPMGKFEKSTGFTVRYLEARIAAGDAVLARLALCNVRLRNKYTAIPYIPFAKCDNVRLTHGERCLDNGRILCADFLEISVTDIDYKIIKSQYEWSNDGIVVEALYTTKYDSLYPEIIEVITRNYQDKTRLKEAQGEETEEEREDRKERYIKAKNKLNGIYGDMVQDTLSQNIDFDSYEYNDRYMKYTPEEKAAMAGMTKEQKRELDRIKREAADIKKRELYEKKGKAPYKLYQWGVWTTAHARDALQEGIALCDGKDEDLSRQLVYVDTDCCKYIGNPDFTALNRERRKQAKSAGIVAVGLDKNKKKKVYYGGVFELETPENGYEAFKTLGAKKYMYTLKGKTRITISGVPKEEGAIEIIEDANKAGCDVYDLFGEGYVFKRAGKTSLVYNTEDKGVVEIDGHRVHITPNVVIRDTPYTLGMGEDGTYSELVDICSSQFKRLVDSWHNVTEW